MYSYFKAMKQRTRKSLGIFSIFLLASSLYLSSCGQVKLGLDWRTANRNSSGIGPEPGSVQNAIVQLYAARAFSWRGIFGIHTWITFKSAGDDAFTVLQVVGWRKRRGLPVVKIEQDIPDRFWYGAKPDIIAQLCGDEAKTAIPKILAAAESYPHADSYRVWPGPNSNTFIVHIVRNVPELDFNLPATAIGKDYLPDNRLWVKPAGSEGVHISLWGILGINLGPDVQGDINFFGASIGAGFNPIHLQLPIMGRIGLKQEHCEAF
ncbi:MAG: DUF3750 domain-containing protein [Magnetococcales bacterium]|nr:DUF3750 domain-containing protein [Magnetococcales bacterium]